MINLADRFAAAGRALLYLALASLSFMRPEVVVGELGIVATDAIAAAAGLCWLAACMLNRRWLRWDRFFWLLTAYFAVMVVSVVFATDPIAGVRVKLASELYLLGLPVLVVGLVTDALQLRGAVLAWLAGTAVLIALAAFSLIAAVVVPDAWALHLVQHRLGSLPLGPFVRYRLGFINPNILGAYLTASLMLVLLAAERRWVNRTASIALVAGLTMATIATFSAGIGGIMLGGAVWAWLCWRKSHPHRAALMLAVGIASTLAFVAAQALTPVHDPSPLFALTVPGTAITLVPASRLQVWIAAAQTFATHPLTGVGIGAEVAHVMFTEPGGHQVLLTDGHNVLLNLAAACGVFGLVAIVAIVVAVWRRGGPYRYDDSDAGLAAVATALGVLNVLVVQGVGGGYEDSRFVWLMIGLLLAASRLRRKRETP